MLVICRLSLRHSRRPTSVVYLYIHYSVVEIPKIWFSQGISRAPAVDLDDPLGQLSIWFGRIFVLSKYLFWIEKSHAYITCRGFSNYIIFSVVLLWMILSLKIRRLFLCVYYFQNKFLCIFLNKKWNIKSAKVV